MLVRVSQRVVEIQIQCRLARQAYRIKPVSKYVADGAVAGKCLQTVERAEDFGVDGQHRVAQILYPYFCVDHGAPRIHGGVAFRVQVHPVDDQFNVHLLHIRPAIRIVQFGIRDAGFHAKLALTLIKRKCPQRPRQARDAARNAPTHQGFDEPVVGSLPHDIARQIAIGL